MKKIMCVFSVCAALLLSVPALAADGEAPHYDILAPDSPESPAGYGLPGQAGLAAASTAPDSPEGTPAPVADVPVDESTYREETPAPYQPPVRLPGQGEIGDILSYWEENGYPDHVSYACEVGGEVMEDGMVYSYWEIGLVDAGETRRQEILDLVSPDCLVNFQNCLFTHTEKQAAYDKLTELAAGDPNILEVIFIRNGDTVWVSVPEDAVKEYAEYLIRDLGLGAVVSVTGQHSIATFEGGLETGADTPIGLPFSAGNDSALVQTTPQIAPAIGGDAQSAPIVPAGGAATGLLPAAPAKRASPIFWVCPALAVIAACALTVLALRRRPARLAVTHSGRLHTAGVPLTRAQAEQLVRDSAEAPPAKLLRAIVERGRKP